MSDLPPPVVVIGRLCGTWHGDPDRVSVEYHAEFTVFTVEDDK
jgi:hypothetical protein